MEAPEVAVIGGGAAGFFAALTCKGEYPHARVTIYEKSNKLLAKVKVSGGGRCNVAHACFHNSRLAKHYPRGGSELKKAFAQFSTGDTVSWFENKGVKLKTEADNRMFPVSDNSQTIIDCLLNESKKLDIKIRTNTPVKTLRQRMGNFELELQGDEIAKADKVIVATGGSPKREGFEWLEKFEHHIMQPVPSLFTFNMPGEAITSLMGVSVQQARVKIQGTKLSSEGPLLITHWGMSGPAVLKLSSFGARILHEMDYHFKILVNWLGDANENDVLAIIESELKISDRKKVSGKNPFDLPNRLWLFFLDKLQIPENKTWSELGKKNTNRLLNTLLNDEYEVKGKTTFKEEFVTCGGVSLQDVSMKTMESKVCPGLYFAGEVLDIDGLTGGFNFQAAWTTGYIAGKSCLRN